MKSVLFLMRKPPYSSMAAREGIDAVLATAAFGVTTGVLFMDDGVSQILHQQQPDPGYLKRTAPMFEALDMYGVESVYVCQKSLQQRGLTPDQLLVPAAPLDAQGIQMLFSQFDHVLTF